MGQKVHPRSLRLGYIQNWQSIWYFKDTKLNASLILEDYVIRKFLKTNYKSSMIADIVIERKAQNLVVKILSARTGVLIGRGGQSLDKLRLDLCAKLNKKQIQIDVIEVAKPDLSSTLIAESIAAQLEKRVAYRRAIKQAIQKAMRAGAKGVKIMVAGRLGGAEIARSEWSKEGRIPLHTFRADIDYGVAEALTMFGIIGVKVWIFKGEIVNPSKTPLATAEPSKSPKSQQPQQPQGRRPKRERG
jgi:small subunit ribosomal protein S3